MSEASQELQPVTGGGLLVVLWRHRLWWMLSIAVLLGLIGIVYVLAHLSAADPETYPTSSRGNSSYTRLS